MRKYFIITTEGRPDLFWNNQDGWGDLASATVFNENEQKSFNLPVEPDNIATWMELPHYRGKKQKVAFSTENLSIYRHAVELSAKIHSISSGKEGAISKVHATVQSNSLQIALSIAAGLGFWEKQWKLVHLNSARRQLLELPVLLELMVALGELLPEREAELAEDVREIMTELNNVIRMVKRREENEGVR